MNIKGIKINMGYEKPIISNFYTKNKAIISKELLIKLIMQSDDIEPLVEDLAKSELLTTDQNKPNKESLELIDHWKKRNWELSLFYYIWSRTGHLSDKGKEYKKKQADTVISYLNESQIPKEHKPKSIKSVQLDKKLPLSQKSIGQVMQEREAVRATPLRTIPLEVLGSILWHGLNTVRGYRTDYNNIEANPLDTVQSFGTAFDIYICIYTSDSLSPGIYFYDIINNQLELTKPMEINELRAKMYHAQVEQKVAYTASVSILLTCDFARYQWRYRQESALRQLYINCGQIVHPLMLLATSYNLKTHVSPAIMDSSMLKIIDLPKEKYQVLYILSIG